MKRERELLSLLVVLAGAALLGCSLKDLIAKADDAGAAASGADAATVVSSAVDAAPATVAPAVNDAGPATKAAAASASAKAKGSAPTCGKGQVLGTVALSPFKPFCSATCKTDADCSGVLACTDVNALAPDGTIAKSGPQVIKLCEPGSERAPSSGKPPAAASGAAAPKCGPNQHFDDINKKCRPFGDCPKGFRWNDPMKTCLDDS